MATPEERIRNFEKEKELGLEEKKLIFTTNPTETKNDVPKFFYYDIVPKDIVLRAEFAKKLNEIRQLNTSNANLLNQFNLKEEEKRNYQKALKEQEDNFESRLSQIQREIEQSKKETLQNKQESFKDIFERFIAPTLIESIILENAKLKIEIAKLVKIIQDLSKQQ